VTAGDFILILVLITAINLIVSLGFTAAMLKMYTEILKVRELTRGRRR
jgi:hypothetical protein